MPLVTLLHFRAATDAYLVKSKLESEGIICYLKNEHMTNLRLQRAACKDGMQLQVNERDLKKANAVLHSIGYTSQHVCPKCGSEQISLIQSQVHGLQGVLAAFRSFILLLNPFSKPKTYCCQKCKYSF